MNKGDICVQEFRMVKIDIQVFQTLGILFEEILVEK